ncbi:MAG: sodium-dependent transporter [Planctomycetaceae bacterium]|jgi:SNF family Na+-dependent transporter|nr:sodium-dependent transporter [Planctomycetaceae bacterium]
MNREKWGGRFGAILAVAGSAIGLGNFIRFPGQAALHGGGAFMIPYIAAFVLLGLPIAWMEWTLGRYAGVRGFNSAPGIFRCVTGKRSMAYAGSLCVTSTMIITMYYLLIESWCLAYALRYLFDTMPGEKFKILFTASTGAAGNGDFFAQGYFNLNLNCLIACIIINYFLIYQGIVKGIERFCAFAMPALFICSLIIFVRVLTLGNPTGIPGQDILHGLGFIWNPSHQGQTMAQSLSNPETWFAAAGQIFFSMSLGFGVICTYASYTRRNDDICLSSLTAAMMNGFCEAVLAALMIVPAAFMFLGPAPLTPENLHNSFAIGFQVLPQVFALMPAGHFFGFLFFFLLFMAAVTSSLSTIQPGIALMEEALNAGRKASVAVIGAITSFGAFFAAYFTKDMLALDTLDFWVANVLIFIMAGVQVIIFAWVMNVKSSMEELHRGSKIRLPRWFAFMFKYITPLYLVIIFIAWIDSGFMGRLRDIADNTVVQLSIGLILSVMVFNFLITSRANKRWEKMQQMPQDDDYDYVM